MEVKPFKYCRLQFSLRTLLIFVTLTTVPLAWWSHKARQQREVVNNILAAGGTILYDFHFQQGLVPCYMKLDSYKEGRPRYWPEWLVNGLGVDYFADVQYVFLAEKTTDADLEHLGKLGALQWLVIDSRHVTDIGVERLKGLTSLTLIKLQGTQVTGAGVKRLQKALPNSGIITD